MKITFVGSSHGVPEAHRKCTCIMIEVGENVYFVDMGCSGMDALRTKGISIDAVKGIFATHMHGDHINGLPEYVELLTWYFKTANPVICLPMLDAVPVLKDWIRVTLSGEMRDLEYREVQPGVIFDDGVLKVTAFATQHCLKSYAYLVEAEGKTVLFTGDLKRPSVDFPDISGKTVDLVVCETAHFPSTEYLPVFEKYDIKKVCVTHYSDRFLASVLTLCDTLNEKGIPALRSMDDLELTV